MFKHETTSVPAKVVDEISTAKEINLEPIIARSRSLLNRNGAGEYKFAHRSFLEYFVVFGIFTNMRMPAKTEFLFSLSGAKLFLFEMLLQSAELTDNIELNQAVQKIVELKQYTGVDSIMAYIQNPKVSFSRRNRIDGFDLEAKLIIRDSDSYDPNSVLTINDSMFVECDASRRIVLHEESPRQAVLIFEVYIGEEHPLTKVSFKIDK